MTKNKKFNKILSFIYVLSLIILGIYKETRPIMFLGFGVYILIIGVKGLLKRVDFDRSPKAKAVGELIFLETIDDTDTVSYKPHYKYIYNNEEKIYVSNFSSYTFKKTKKIGDKEDLLILIKNPKLVKENKKSYRFIEYFGTSLFIVFGLGIIILSAYLFIN